MTFIIPVGRPLYEGVLSSRPDAPALPAQPPTDERAAERGRDQVNLSAEAKAYLETRATAPQRQEPAPQTNRVDKTV